MGNRCSGGAEAIAGVGAEGVEAAEAVVGQGEGSKGQAGRFCRGGEAGKGPVDSEGDQVGDELLGAGRQAADKQAGVVGEASSFMAEGGPGAADHVDPSGSGGS